jgi:hypothetical protein
LDIKDGTTTMYVDDDGDNGDGGDGNGNGNGNSESNSNDAATVVVGVTVNEDNGGNLRMAIGQRQLDNNNGMTMM